MGYVLGIIGAFIFIGFLMVLAKKDKERLGKYLENLPENIKTRLANVNIEKFNEEKIQWTQDAYICDVIEKGDTIEIVFLWHNKVIQNNLYDTIELGDSKMRKFEFDELGIQKGDFVRVDIDAKNSKTKIITKI